MSRRADTSRKSRPPAREGDPLTRREREILALVADGDSSLAISNRLGLSDKTVKSHLTHAYRKLGVKNRVQAARHYVERYPGGDRIDDATASEASGDSSLIKRQIHEIEARLDYLAGVAAEADRLRRALEALRSIERS